MYTTKPNNHDLQFQYLRSLKLLVVEMHKLFKMNWEIFVNIEEGVGDGRERDKLDSSVALYCWATLGSSIFITSSIQ